MEIISLSAKVYNAPIQGSTMIEIWGVNDFEKKREFQGRGSTPPPGDCIMYALLQSSSVMM